MPKFILFFCIAIVYSAMAESAQVYSLSSKTESQKSRHEAMCQQARDILNLMKSFDSGLDYEMNCESSSFYSETRLFGLTRQHENFKTAAKFSGSTAQSCLVRGSQVDSFRLIKVKPMISGYSSSNGMPTGVNPYLVNLLEKLGVESQLVILDTNYGSG